MSKITQQHGEWGQNSNLGHHPLPQTPQTRARRAAPLTHSSGAPSLFKPGLRGPDPPTVPCASSGRPAYAPTALAASVPQLKVPVRPPRPQCAHLRTRAALVAPPRSPAPFPPTRPRDALARPPPHLGVHATSLSGAPAGGGALRVASISGCLLCFPLAGRAVAGHGMEIVFLPDSLT